MCRVLGVQINTFAIFGDIVASGISLMIVVVEERFSFIVLRGKVLGTVVCSLTSQQLPTACLIALEKEGEYYTGGSRERVRRGVSRGSSVTDKCTCSSVAFFCVLPTSGPATPPPLRS